MPKRKAGQPGVADWSSHHMSVGHEFESTQDQEKKLEFEFLWFCLKVGGNGPLLASARAPNLSLE